jgi:hypothetical protein
MKIKFSAFQLLTISIFYFFTSVLSAQTDTSQAVSLSGNVDFVSRYIWRGLEIGQAPNIQPALSVKWKDFTLGGWGAYRFAGPGDQETDFYLSKKIGFLTLTFSDYWTFRDTTEMNFFDYNEKTTAHILETMILLSGGETLRFNILGSYFFYGADTTKSIYLELQYFHKIDQTDLLLFAGFQPKGKYYGPNATFVNIGCTVKRPIPVTNRFSLPLSLSLIVNPDRKSVYLVAGISL